jgi:N-acetylmuramoyl-L-alanine amidase
MSNAEAMALAMYCWYLSIVMQLAMARNGRAREAGKHGHPQDKRKVTNWLNAYMSQRWLSSHLERLSAQIGVMGILIKKNHFTILSKTLCPAVLTENFFQDNKEDVAYMLSAEGKKAIIKCHVDGIINYINGR